MPESKQRIIVDGIDFKELFRFPRIIWEAAAALQPPRLVIALLTVLLLIALGRIWDGVTPATVHPGGILAGTIDEATEERIQSQLRGLYQRHVPQDDWPEGAPQEWPTLDAASAKRDIRRAYRAERRELDRDERAQRDEAFTGVLRTIDRARPRNTFEATGALVIDGFNHLVWGTLTLSPETVTLGLADLFIHLPAALWRDHKAFTIIYGIIFLLLLAIGGGAIARMAACEVAQGERLRAMDAFQFSMTNWPRLVLAPLLPLLIIAVLALLIAVVGLIMYVPVLDILGGLIYIIMLLLGFAIAFLLIGYVLAFPLFIPAVACENCDAPDAQQRAYAYVVSRPLHWLGYTVITLIGLALGFLVVSIFALVVLNGTAAMFGAFHGHSALNAAGGFNIFDFSQRMEDVLHPRWHHSVTAWFIGLWQTVVIGLVAAYVFSYLFSAWTVVYLLLRRSADGQAIEEIWRPGLIPGTLAPVPRREDAGEAAESSPTEAQSQQPDADEADRDDEQQQNRQD